VGAPPRTAAARAAASGWWCPWASAVVPVPAARCRRWPPVRSWAGVPVRVSPTMPPPM
jgi:hypothetical protein